MQQRSLEEIKFLQFFFTISGCRLTYTKKSSNLKSDFRFLDFCRVLDVFYFLKYAVFKGLLALYMWEV